MLITIIKVFWDVGRGTLAPWAPPEKLVVLSPFRYVLNLMISSVLLVLLGGSEEPVLVRRFGEEYLRYRENVPRWLPRLRPWRDGRGQ